MSDNYPVKIEEVILENAEYNSTEEIDEELQLQLEDSGGESYHQIDYVNETTATSTTHNTKNSAHNSSMKNSGSNNGAGTANGESNLDGGGGGVGLNKSALESEKRMRREIANSNERRRMQSINAGFQNLRSLLPRQEGEKLSKAAILQQTSQYIVELESQKTQLLAQNSQLKRQLGQHESNNDQQQQQLSSGDAATVPPTAIKKRKLTDNVISMQTISDSSDEGLGSMSPEPMTLLNAASGGAVNTAAAAAAAAAVNKQNAAAAIIAHNTAKELLDMKKQLEKERRMRQLLDEELQMIKRQLYSVATAAPPQAVCDSPDDMPPSPTTAYIPREVIEHTDNHHLLATPHQQTQPNHHHLRTTAESIVEELPAGTVSYVEIDEATGQQQVVICSSIEELEPEECTSADYLQDDNMQEEVILSSNSSTESEQEVASMNAIAKAYAEGSSPSAAVLQPILQAAIKATPKVEVERITGEFKVKTEKIEQASGLTRSRQNLETIVEAIRHLEGDHLFAEGTIVGEKIHVKQEVPLALTTKHAQRATIAELSPFLMIKGSGGKPLTLTHQQLMAAKAITQQQLKAAEAASNSSSLHTAITPTAIYKVQTSNAVSSNSALGKTASSTVTQNQQVTITTSALKQCRPGVIVAKQLS